MRKIFAHCFLNEDQKKYLENNFSVNIHNANEKILSPDELIEYANNIGVGAVIGDSFMYLLATPLLYILLKLKDEDNQFISLVCTYIIGYIVYQKPII